MKSEKNISKNLTDEIFSDDGNESIYETSYAYHRYDDYDKSRPIEIVLNVSNDHSIDISDDQDVSIYEEPYSSNIYDVYDNNSPEKICLDAFLKDRTNKKWWFLFLAALFGIGALVVGLSIYFTKNPVGSSTSATTTLLTTTPILLQSTTPISLTSTTPISLPTTTPILFPSTTEISIPSTTPRFLPSTTIVTTAPSVKKAVLVLSTYRPSNLPLVIGLNGKIDDDINFVRDFNTEVLGSCTASLNDHMYVFGGSSHNRQISKVQDCKLTTVGELPFRFSNGGCNTFSFGVMLCFGESRYDYKSCYSFDGDYENFKTEPSSNFEHNGVNALGSYRKSPFVTGSYWFSRAELKTEIFDRAAGQWNQVADYPFTNGEGYITDYATSHTEDSVYIIGGRWKSGSSSGSPTIAQFKDNEWTIAGSLKQPRDSHGAITVNGRTMIFGGSGSYTELLEYESFETEEIEPILNSYYNPGLFLVEDGFCSKKINQNNSEP